MVADRVYQSREDLAPTTMTSSTYASKCSMTVTSANLASSTWCLFASGQHSESTNTTTSSAMRLRNNTAGTTLADVSQEAASTSSVYPFTLIAPVTFGAAPGDQTFRIEQASPSNVSTVGSENLRLFGIKLRGNDTVVTAAGPFNPPSNTTTYTTVVTFTAPANGTYDIIIGARLAYGGGTTSNVPVIEVIDTDGTTVLRKIGQFVNTDVQNKDGTDVSAVAFAVTKTMTTGQTIFMRVGRSAGTNTNHIYTNAFAIGFDAAEWPGRQIVNEDVNEDIVTVGVTSEWIERANSQLAYAVGDVSDYFAMLGTPLSRATGSATTARFLWTVGGAALFVSPNLAGTSSGPQGFVAGRVLTARSDPFAIEPMFGTGSGISFSVDSWGSLAAVYKLKAGTGAPTNTPRARGPKPRSRNWRTVLGLPS